MGKQLFKEGDAKITGGNGICKECTHFSRLLPNNGVE